MKEVKKQTKKKKKKIRAFKKGLADLSMNEETNEKQK